MGSPALADMDVFTEHKEGKVSIKPLGIERYYLEMIPSLGNENQIESYKVVSKVIICSYTTVSDIEDYYKLLSDLVISKSSKLNEDFNPFEEFKEIFIDDKPVDLSPIRQPYEIMQHHIPIMRYPDNYHNELLRGKLMTWKGGKIPNYNRALDELGDKIFKELKSRRIKTSKAISTIPIFIKWKENGKPRFLLNCIPRNIVTEKDNGLLPSIDDILDWITNMPSIITIDLADGYHNIRVIIKDEVHTVFTYDLGIFESRVIQQEDCNAPRTMMRVMNHLLFDFK